MSEQEQNDHGWFSENIATALAGGLDAAARARFAAHAAECESCAAELAANKELERHMSGFFASPAAGLEDRLIDALRNQHDHWRPQLRIHPAVQRAVVATAAVLVLAGFGYLADQRIEGQAGPAFVKVASNLRQIGQAINHYSNDNRGIYPREVSPARSFGASPSYSYQDPRKEADAVGSGFKFQNTLGNEFAVAANLNPSANAHYFEGPAASSLGFGLQSSALRGEGKSVGNISGGKQFRGVVAGDNAAKNNLLPADADGDRAADSARGDLQSQSKVAPFKPLELQKAGEQEATKSGGFIMGREASLLQSSIAVVNAAPAAGAPVVALTTPAQQAPAMVPAPTEHENPSEVAPTTRKVIRNGQMEFEVDRFDAAFAQVSKLTTEAGGYIGTTDSEKLPNGKVKGTVTLRVPPDRLDTLVLQLRGIGDLKSQKLDANDVTKQYTDLESELRADKAMEERLLAMIKDGKGQIKELLMAEKELGNWREKIEKIVGEMRYFDSQVAMSTLQLTLYERDIKTPATAKETESIDAGLEADDVEKARADALKAIEEAKGRVIQSELKKYDAGQFGATIVAEVPPDAAGPLVDRLKQIGKVARLEIQRKQASDPNADSAAPVRVEKQNTRLNLSLYNLANVAPRTTSAVNLAADDVAKAYRAILDRVTRAGGRVVSSSLSQNKPEQTTGQISFEVPTADADAVTNDLRAMGEVMKLSVTDNPDVNNVTTAKRGFALQLIATAAVAPRETQTLQVAAASVADAREKILSAASAGGARVLVSQLNENDRNNPSAAVEVDVPRGALAVVGKAIESSGDIVSRSVSRSNDAENVLDTKVKLQVSLVPADKLPPRETTALTIELNDVDVAMAKLQQDVAQAGGRVVESNLSKDSGGATRGTFSFEVPLDKSQPLIDEAKQQGTVRAAQSGKNLQATTGTLAKARVELSLVTPDTIVEPGTGPWATIRNGWATSVKALLWSLELVVIGLCTVLPFCLVIWGGWKLLKRRTKPGIEVRG